MASTPTESFFSRCYRLNMRLMSSCNVRRYQCDEMLRAVRSARKTEHPPFCLLPNKSCFSSPSAVASSISPKIDSFLLLQNAPPLMNLAVEDLIIWPKKKVLSQEAYTKTCMSPWG